jgi:hypothetical protein
VPSPLVSSLPRVRVCVRVLLELTRAAGWMLEKTLIRCDLRVVVRTVGTL